MAFDKEVFKQHINDIKAAKENKASRTPVSVDLFNKFSATIDSIEFEDTLQKKLEEIYKKDDELYFYFNFITYNEGDNKNPFYRYIFYLSFTNFMYDNQALFDYTFDQTDRMQDSDDSIVDVLDDCWILLKQKLHTFDLDPDTIPKFNKCIFDIKNNDTFKFKIKLSIMEN